MPPIPRLKPYAGPAILSYGFRPFFLFGALYSGLAVLTWWLTALSRGADSYAIFEKASHHPVGLIILIGLTWSFFQHLLSGIRHLVMDTGAALELGPNKSFSILTIVGSILLTAAMWIYILEVRP